MGPAWRAIAIALSAAAFGVACGGAAVAPTVAPSSSPKPSLTLALQPTNQPQAVLRAVGPITDYLARAVGVPVTASVPAGYAAVLKGLTSGTIDAAWVNPLAYVALRGRAPVELVSSGARCLPTYTAAAPPPGCAPAPSTPAIIVCNVAAPVGELRNGGDWSALRGVRFALGASTSLTAGLWPRYYLQANGVDPAHALGKVLTLASENGIAIAVYNDTVDCGGMTGDARTSVLSVAPDIMNKTKVVFVAPQPVPGDAQVIRSGLNPAQKAKLRAAILRLGRDAQMRGALQALYRVDALQAAADRDYDPVRTVVARVDPGVTAGVIATPTPGT